jgi:hypothetical protein
MTQSPLESGTAPPFQVEFFWKGAGLPVGAGEDADEGKGPLWPPALGVSIPVQEDLRHRPYTVKASDGNTPES